MNLMIERQIEKDNKLYQEMIEWAIKTGYYQKRTPHETKITCDLEKSSSFAEGLEIMNKAETDNGIDVVSGFYFLVETFANHTKTKEK